jgi:ribosomal-protein-alanine N-acetyltransferase
MRIRLINDLDMLELLKVEESSQVAPWSEAAFSRCFEAGYPGWCIENDDKIVGFILLSLTLGECHILNLCISPTHQRRGHGYHLLTYALVWAKEQGASVVYLEVRRSNAQAIALYRKMNFKQIGERKDYYPMPKGREDALIFARDLSMVEVERPSSY